jgi:hypothetical protein
MPSPVTFAFRPVQVPQRGQSAVPYGQPAGNAAHPSQSAPSAPSAMSAPSAPSAASAQSAASAPNASSAQSAPGALSAPSAPSALSAPSAPSALSAPSAPSAPSAQPQPRTIPERTIPQRAIPLRTIPLKPITERPIAPPTRRILTNSASQNTRSSRYGPYLRSWKKTGDGNSVDYSFALASAAFVAPGSETPFFATEFATWLSIMVRTS